jgi:hypothetical protein
MVVGQFDCGNMPGVEKNQVQGHNCPMQFQCECGERFEMIPREIPLGSPERVYCENCLTEIKGPRCTRYVDYVPVNETVVGRPN